MYSPIGCRHPFDRHWHPLLGKPTATCSLPHPKNERQWRVNNLELRILYNLCSDWLWTSIFEILSFFIENNYTDMLRAASWEWASLERHGFLALHHGWCIFWWVADIQSSDTRSLYWEKRQWYPLCRIVRIILNGTSTMFSFASCVISVTISCRNPFMRYWQPLLARTTVRVSLPHPETECQRGVNSFSCSILGNLGIARIFMFITESLTAQIGKNTIYQRYNTHSSLIYIGSCKACKNILLVVENAILIRY